MDTSKEYIEMCKKAQEIQEIKEMYKDYDKGDFYDRYGFIEVASPYSSCEEYADDNYCDEIQQRDKSDIWLPRQDQLFDLIMELNNNFGCNDKLQGIFINNIYAFNRELYHNQSQTFDTLEKVYLSFVMKGKYNKVWDINSKEWKIIE